VVIEKIEEQMEREARDIVERGRKLAEERGFKVEVVVERGSPHDKILEVAMKRGVDLIVMGSRGRRKLLHRMLGVNSVCDLSKVEKKKNIREHLWKGYIG